MLGSNNYLGLTHHPKVLEAASRALQPVRLGLHRQPLPQRHARPARAARARPGRVPRQGRLPRLLHRLSGQPRPHLGARRPRRGGLPRQARPRLDRRRRQDVLRRDRALQPRRPRRPRAQAASGTTAGRGLDDRRRRRVLDGRRHRRRARPRADRAQVRRGAGPRRRALARRARPQRRRHRRALRHDRRGRHHRRHVLQVAGVDRRLRRRLSESVIHYLGTTAGRSSSPRRCRRPTPPACSRRCEVLQDEPERRDQLWANTRRLHDGFRSLGFDIGPTETPIVPVLIGPLEKTFLMWRKLFDAGVFTNPVVPPAVPPSQCRLRTSLMATHTFEQIDFCARAVRAHRPGAGGHLTDRSRVRAGARPAATSSASSTCPTGCTRGTRSGSRRCVGTWQLLALPRRRIPSSSTPRPSTSSPSATARSSAASRPSPTGCTTRLTATGSASSASSSASTTRPWPTRSSRAAADWLRAARPRHHARAGLLLHQRRVRPPGRRLRHAAHPHDAAQPALLRRRCSERRGLRQGQGSAGLPGRRRRISYVPVPERLARGTELDPPAAWASPSGRST